LNLDLPELEWISLCREQIAKGKSISQVARETGLARPSLSMILSGTYPAQSLDLASRKHAARVVQLYRDRVLCPYLRTGLTADQCRAYASAPMSTSDPEQLSQCRACRRCPLNPITAPEVA
jgi:transcriptional regulator with XRE-family HTH domain